VTGEERQPWELAEEESGEPVEEAAPTSEPIDESERGRAGGDEERPTREDEDDAPAERSHAEEGEVGAGSQYAEEDAEEHSDPRGPAGGAGGPR
jgi:hypothetical protein